MLLININNILIDIIDNNIIKIDKLNILFIKYNNIIIDVNNNNK